jgi:hypothetical protein
MNDINRIDYTPLAKVADVFTGITLRGESASRNDPNGTHRLIRIGDLSSDGVVGAGAPGRVRVDGKDSDRYTLRAGDLLVAARGSRLTAAVFDRTENAVAGSQFLVIRIRSAHSHLSAGFLAWYLNLPAIQEQLAAQMRGSYIRSLPAGVLAQLHVPIPDQRTQAAIVKLTALQREENRLTTQIAAHRARLIQQLATNSIQFNPRSNVIG